MNEYRWGEMSTEVVVDQNLWTVELLTFVSTDLVRGPYGPFSAYNAFS